MRQIEKHETLEQGYFFQFFAWMVSLFIVSLQPLFTIIMIRNYFLGLLAMLGVNTLQAAVNELKPRLVVCTDIAPADVEPDDMESMVRLMAYADQFEIEALITSVGWNCDPYPVEWAQYLQRVIEAYRKDVPNLM